MADQQMATDLADGGGWSPATLLKVVGNVLGFVGNIVRAKKYKPVASPDFMTQLQLIEYEDELRNDKIVGLITLMVIAILITIIYKKLRK